MRRSFDTRVVATWQRLYRTRNSGVYAARRRLHYVITSHRRDTNLCLGWLVQTLTGDQEVDDRDYELKQLMEGERFTPLFKVCLDRQRTLGVLGGGGHAGG